MDDKDDIIKTNYDKKVVKQFSCEHCHYNTSRKSNFDKHLYSAKHTRMTNDDNGGQKVAEMESKKEFICNCGRSYKQTRFMETQTRLY